MCAGRAADASRTCPATGAGATVDGHRVAVGNQRLMDREGSTSGRSPRGERSSPKAGRTVVIVAIEGRAAG